MILEIREVDVFPNDEAKIGELEYGCLVTNVPGSPHTLYSKVNKNKVGVDLRLNFEPKMSVLYNPKLGTLRAIPGNTVVKVKRGKLKIAAGNASEFRKSTLRGKNY